MAFSSSYSSEELISLFTTLAYVFMGIAILGLALAVFFFFYFDIPTVYITMTGKAKKDTIRKMEEENFKSGKLRYQYPATTGKTKRSGKLGKNAFHRFHLLLSFRRRGWEKRFHHCALSSISHVTAPTLPFASIP